MARITIAAVQAALAQVTVERDEALEALHMLRSEVLQYKLAEASQMRAERPSRQAPINVEKRCYRTRDGRSFIKTRAVGSTIWTIREVV